MSDSHQFVLLGCMVINFFAASEAIPNVRDGKRREAVQWCFVMLLSTLVCAFYFLRVPMEARAK